MNYKATLSYIMEQLPMYQRIGKPAYRSGLDNTISLDEYFNHPHRNFQSIHVAGTNGKGSVSHMLASVLQEAGYKVGLYTSPHLLDFRERIRVNGKMISKRFVTSFINSHQAYFHTLDPSFFEISVFMAFAYFTHCHVDIAIIEVGLGGRLDATNIISPLLSIITNIGKDHTEILGDTLQEIASEKAGIIKENTPVVIGERQPETYPVFSAVCDRQKSPMVMADNDLYIGDSLMSNDDFQVFNVNRNGEIYLADLKCGLLGHYQRRNTITVLTALEQLPDIQIDEKDVYKGLKNVIANTGLLGRWQLIQRHPKVICDTAHNADGIKVILQQVNDTPYKYLHLIIGFVNDKDIHAILRYMPVTASYYFVRLSVPRTMDEEALALEAKQYGLNGQAFPHIKEAYKKAKENASRNDLILITGSNFLVADFLSLKNNTLHFLSA